MEIKEKIKSRISELSKEIEELIAERETIHERIHEINIRIAHIVGAIEELDKIDKEEENV